MSLLRKVQVLLSDQERRLSDRTMREILNRYPDDDLDHNPANTTVHDFAMWKWRTVPTVANTEPGVRKGWDPSW